MQADLLIEEATLFDGKELLPQPVSVAVAEGKIIEVSASSLAHLGGPNTRRKRLGGNFMMPGLIDVHNHHALAGRAELFELELPVGASLDQILEAVSEHASTIPPNAWITGGPWGTNLLNELNDSNSLKRLDRASAGRPVVLIEDSRHNRWASSEAMRLAGILETAQSEHEAGILRDPATSQPTGVLLERAGLLVEYALQREGGFTTAEHMASSKRGVEVLNSFGVTAFQDAAASLEILGALNNLDAAGELNAWAVTALTMNDDIFGFSPIGQALIDQAESFRSRHHAPDFVKVFLDGVPPARTAAFLEPYLPDAEHGDHHAGSLLIQQDQFAELLFDTAAQGYGVKVHCAGDASARAVLDAAQKLRDSGDSTTRIHIAHGQILAESDIPRLAALNVTADMSPFVWFPGVIPTALKEVLPPRIADKIQPTRDLLEHGALLTMGSDWPVSPSPNPWVGIHGLVTRTDPFRSFPGTLWPEQALTVSEALRICTTNGAEAIGLGKTTGMVAPGYSADFILLDESPFDRSPSTLVDTTVLETWFEGRQVYTALE